MLGGIRARGEGTEKPPVSKSVRPRREVLTLNRTLNTI